MLRWLVAMIMGFGLWLVAGTAGAQSAPPLTCPQTISGQIDSPGDLKQKDRINQGVAATTCAGAVPAPGIIAGSFGYDKYTFRNRVGADACVAITLKATGDVNSGRGLSAAAYVDAFDPANISTNFIGHTGNAANPGTNPATNTRQFHVKVPAQRDFVVVVNEVFDGGAGAYDLTVEGCGKFLISPNFGPRAGGTPVILSGVGFQPGSAVTFGGVAGTQVQVVNDGEIHVTTPPFTGSGASPHAVDVAVTSGSDSQVEPGGFKYYDPAATVLSLEASPPRVEYGGGPSLIGSITPAKNPNAPTGAIVFFEGTDRLGSGPISAADSKGRLSVGRPAVGVHTYTASYAGDSFYNSATSNTATITITQSRSTTTLSSSQNPSGPGDEVTYTAIVKGTFASNTTGTVVFTEDGVDSDPVPMENGRASLKKTYATTTTTPHRITAHYNGDTNFQPSTSAVLLQNVSATAPDITITPTPADATYGTDVTFAVKVATRPSAAVPTGRVQLNIDGQNVGADLPLSATGDATFPAQKLLGGTHVIKVAYTGDTNYARGEATLPFEVKGAETQSKVESSKLNSAVGEAVTFTATITSSVQGGVALTGTVQFMDGSEKLGPAATLVSGVAKLVDVKSLTQGTHQITAVYVGDTNYATSTSSAIEQVVGSGGGGDAGTDGGKDAGDGGNVKPDASGVDSGSNNGGNASTEGGGCDCNTTGTPASGLMALLGGLGFALMLVRRRRS